MPGLHEVGSRRHFFFGPPGGAYGVLQLVTQRGVGGGLLLKFGAKASQGGRCPPQGVAQLCELGPQFVVAAGVGGCQEGADIVVLGSSGLQCVQELVPGALELHERAVGEPEHQAEELSALCLKPAIQVTDDLTIDLARLEVDIRVQVVEGEVLRPRCSFSSCCDLFAREAERVQEVVGERGDAFRGPQRQGAFQSEGVWIEEIHGVGGVSLDGPSEHDTFAAGHDLGLDRQDVIADRRGEHGAAAEGVLEEHQQTGLTRADGAGDHGGRTVEAVGLFRVGRRDGQGNDAQVDSHVRSPSARAGRRRRADGRR